MVCEGSPGIRWMNLQVIWICEVLFYFIIQVMCFPLDMIHHLNDKQKSLYLSFTTDILKLLDRMWFHIHHKIMVKSATLGKQRKLETGITPKGRQGLNTLDLLSNGIFYNIPYVMRTAFIPVCTITNNIWTTAVWKWRCSRKWGTRLLEFKTSFMGAAEEEWYWEERPGQ